MSREPTAADRQPVGPAGRRVVAMGGGGFTMDERSPALDRLVLELAPAPVPRICFLPTASGDPRDQVTRFYERFGGWPCEPSTLSLFHLARDRIDDPVGHLLAQDAIYVGGGSMRNMLAVWREHGIDRAMRTAWERGVLLAGLSAGAMCWFDGGISMSSGAPEPVAGLGLVPGSLSVHLDGQPERLARYLAAVGGGELPPGYAADDGAALVLAGTALEECVASRAGARVMRVGRVGHDKDGGASMRPVAVRVLPQAEGPSASVAREAAAVSEFRGLRAGRHRWD